RPLQGHRRTGGQPADQDHQHRRFVDRAAAAGAGSLDGRIARCQAGNGCPGGDARQPGRTGDTGGARGVEVTPPRLAIDGSAAGPAHFSLIGTLLGQNRSEMNMPAWSGDLYEVSIRRLGNLTLSLFRALYGTCASRWL